MGSTHTSPQTPPETHNGIIEAKAAYLILCFTNACRDQGNEKKDYNAAFMDGLNNFDNHVQQVTIPPFIDTQLKQFNGGEGIKDDLEKLFVAFNTSLSSANPHLPQNQQVNGQPGSNILNSFLMRKIMGDTINEDTLFRQLNENGVICDEQLCRTIDAFAKFYIEQCLTFYEDKAPNLYWEAAPH